MTNHPNGWPSKPGMPVNPEREGHHWILTPDGEDAVYLWRPAGECERGRWPSAWVHDVDDWEPREGIYLGPCLTPAEVEALQADLGAQFERAKLSEVLHNQHVTKLEIENARLREAIEMAIDCIQDKDVIGASLTLTKTLGETQ
jgi:hypothetical protein